ncbi:hypothetical protein PY365_22060 [Roseiarcaceae bacterium H3SJ34-1]|uniref:hypothetical protein n=1 Tax=Terripilifer ovatus TaxID=3032367 RepID=UPI003AB94216|nr:hypothetical protein [Roseiarcaceae bacterium H3SJ34-1]
MTVLSRKILTGAVAALAMGAALSTSVSTAQAGWRGGWGHGGWGAPVAAGVIGGLALGAIAAQAQPRYAYPVADPTYGYQAYGDVSYCHVERRPTYNPWGYFAGWQAVRVCE